MSVHGAPTGRLVVFVHLIVATLSLVCSPLLWDIQVASAQVERSRARGAFSKRFIFTEASRDALLNVCLRFLEDRIEESVNIELPTKRGQRTLILKPHDQILAPDYRRSKNGISEQTHGRYSSCFLSGELLRIRGPRERRKLVRFSAVIDHEKHAVLPESLIGLFRTKHGVYLVNKPSRKRTRKARKAGPSAGESFSIVELDGKALGDVIGECASSEHGKGEELFHDQSTASPLSAAPSPMAAPAALDLEGANVLQFDLATDADFEFHNAYENAGGANQRILSIVNIVDGVYRDQLAVGIRVVHQNVWTTSDDPYETGNAIARLSQLSRHWEDNFQHIERHSTHLFTGVDIFTSSNRTVGIAGGDIGCTRSGYAMSENWGGERGLVVILAHELGHTLRAGHDIDGDGTHIMKDTVTNSRTFSLRSKRAITSHIEHISSCLTPLQTGTAPLTPPEIFRREDTTYPPTEITLYLIPDHEGGAGATYNIYRSTTQTACNGEPYITGFSAREIVDNDIVDRTDYYYSVEAVSDSGEKSTCTPTVLARAELPPPIIIAHPRDTGAPVGHPVTFSTRALYAHSYQWYRNGTPILSATEPEYTLPGVSYDDDGAQFFVEMRNPIGSAQSISATLSVTPSAFPVLIEQQPVDTTAIIDPSIVSAPVIAFGIFSVLVHGTPPLQYQWFKDGTPIADGAGESSNAFDNLSYWYRTPSAEDEGSEFWIEVTNALGTVVSTRATLHVHVSDGSPFITFQPRDAVTSPQSGLSFLASVCPEPVNCLKFLSKEEERRSRFSPAALS